jgi:hypothetical protein
MMMREMVRELSDVYVCVLVLTSVHRFFVKSLDEDGCLPFPY